MYRNRLSNEIFPSNNVEYSDLSDILRFVEVKKMGAGRVELCRLIYQHLFPFRLRDKRLRYRGSGHVCTEARLSRNGWFVSRIGVFAQSESSEDEGWSQNGAERGGGCLHVIKWRADLRHHTTRGLLLGS